MTSWLHKSNDFLQHPRRPKESTWAETARLGQAEVEPVPSFWMEAERATDSRGSLTWPTTSEPVCLGSGAWPAGRVALVQRRRTSGFGVEDFWEWERSWRINDTYLQMLGVSPKIDPTWCTKDRAQHSPQIATENLHSDRAEKSIASILVDMAIT